MKRFLAFVTILLLTAGFCRAEVFEIVGKTESYTAKVTFLEGQPVKGSNRMRIEIIDAAFRYVKEGRVEIEYLMPSLPGKPPMMDYHTTAERVGASYEATLRYDRRMENDTLRATDETYRKGDHGICGQVTMAVHHRSTRGATEGAAAVW